jgi:hypothetical protein
MMGGGQSLGEWLDGNKQRTALLLSTQGILRKKGHKLSDKRRDELEWLSFVDSSRDPRAYSERRLRQGHELMATLTRDSIGRQMLEDMGRFSLAALRGQNDGSAANYLLNMADVWPEIDRRNLRDNSYMLNEYLRRQGEIDVGSFIRQVGIVASSVTEFSNDVGVHLWKPDTLRRVAVKTGSTDLMNLAIEGYEKVREQQRASELVEGKLEKAKKQAKTLAKKD